MLSFMAKRARKPRRFKVRTVRRDRFGRFNPRGRTVQRIRVAILPKLPAVEPEAPRPPRGALSLVDDAHPEGRYAFLARDQRPDIADRFGRFFGTDRQITASLKFGYTDPKSGKKFDVPHTITFDVGEDEEEFWDNYADAVREALDEVSGTAESETGGRYSKFGIAVTYMM